MDQIDFLDTNNWYFGAMSRLQATEALMNEKESGTFLVRDSNTIAGDYVLCVRENTKVSNYIINKIQQQDQVVYRIGDQSFDSMINLLKFYVNHYLDTTSLIRPLSRKIERVVAKFDFDGNDAEDLPFRRGEILTIIRKNEDQWWTARNSAGKVGSIPVPYVQRCEQSEDFEPSASGGNICNNTSNTIPNSKSPRFLGAICSSMGNNNLGSRTSSTLAANSCHLLGNALKKSDLNRKLPARARVKQARVPNAYDKTALKLEVGDIILVTKTNINGQWEGRSGDKIGHFPFTHVEFLNDDSENSIPSDMDEVHIKNTNNDWGE